VVKLVLATRRDFEKKPLLEKRVNGLRVPTWLPAGSATDQAALLVQGLINWVAYRPDATLTLLIRNLAKGIAQMQHGDGNTVPYSCILSWENVWHAYGSDAALALFKAGTYLEDTSYVKQAFAEVDHFYPWLQREGLLASFILDTSAAAYTVSKREQFAQIAYGIRPMLFAAAEAFTRTGDARYAETVARFGAWFYGVNVAGAVMYDSLSGRGYDGIIGSSEVNRNSGAESTIEALLALQKIESLPAIMAALQKETTAPPPKQ
jgi:hypothetical protein